MYIDTKKKKSSVELRIENEDNHKDWFPLAHFTASEVK